MKGKASRAPKPLFSEPSLGGFALPGELAGVAMGDFFIENCTNNGVLPISLKLPA